MCMRVASMTEMRRSFLSDSATSEKNKRRGSRGAHRSWKILRAGSAKSDHAMKIQIAFNLR